MDNLTVDIRWLLDVQEDALSDLSVRDFSALQAAVARHRVNTPQLGVKADAAWRAAALLHTIVLLNPLPARNPLYACAVATYYMTAAGEGMDPPYGGLVDLVREIITGKTDVFGTADRLRAWRIA